MQGFPFDSHVTFDESGIPQYDRGVSSQPLRKLIAKLFTSGVMPNPSDNLQVSAGSDGMTVIVQKGFAVTDGGLCPEENVRTLSVTASHPTLDRIDTVVVRWNENDDVRKADLHILQGVPAKNPVRPTLTRTSSIYELGLADIFVTKGVVTITNEKITDTRMESARCGIVSSVSKWDTTTIYQQIQSDLAGFKSNEQAEFMAWFNKMKGQLTTDAAGRLQTEIDDVTSKLQNLQIGGRNLIKDSKGEFSGKYPNSGYYSPVVLSVNLPAYATQFVLSFEAKSTVAGDIINSYFYNPSDIIKTEGSNGFISYTNNDGGIEYTLTTDWTRYWVKWTAPVAETRTVLPCRLVAGKGTGTVSIRNIKFETGNIATDWSPAPEDLNENVAAMFDVIRPVGSLYSTTDASFNPNTAKGWHGTWERITDCVIYAAGTSDTIGAIVGSNTHKLTEAELASHRHTIPSLNGSTNETGEHTHDFKWKQALTMDGSHNRWYTCTEADETSSRNELSAGNHKHTVTTNASNTGYTGSGTAIDMRPRRLNSVVWRRTA